MEKKQSKRKQSKQRDSALKKELKTGQRDFKELSYSRMIFSGVGHMLLLILAFWLHWSFGGLYLVFWLFILPFLELKRLQKRERDNPLPKLSKESRYDDAPLFKERWDQEEKSWKEEWQEGWDETSRGESKEDKSP